MSDSLPPGKKIVLSRHFFVRWAERINSEASLSNANRQTEIVAEIRKILDAKKYFLVFDENDGGLQKYRVVCKMFGEIITFLVLDCKDTLFFKSVWLAKKWEEMFYKKEVKT